jgi:UDP-N-acetylglucosamine 2-epimerase (non-hydrolysing)/GDP/UDP-N,N'-diacetylbacillosamine 2-epimerase (hydrolysing)
MLPVIKHLQRDTTVDLELLVSGGHLVPCQGETLNAVNADGFAAAEQVDVVLASDTPVAVTKSFGLAVIGYADALRRLSPDVVLVAGDRSEALAFVVAAFLRGLVIAHFGGGQVTEGSLDNGLRQAISKLATIHFVMHCEHREQLLAIGEKESAIHVVGNFSFDHLSAAEGIAKESLERDLGIDLVKPVLVATYHPVTANQAESRAGLRALLAALRRLPESTVVFTAPNTDAGSREIEHTIIEFVSAAPRRAVYVPSLGQRRYLSLLSYADAVVGNSSSGLMEAPEIGLPTVNIGTRQKGRRALPSIIDCSATPDAVINAIRLALSGRVTINRNATRMPDVDLQLISSVLRDKTS